jgi:hypothetical protein
MSKQKLYSIAVVSVAMTLMLISTAGAMKFGDVILKTDPASQSVDFLKFPVSGWDPSSWDKTGDTQVNKDPKEQTVVNQYNYNNNPSSCNNSCDKCSAPALIGGSDKGCSDKGAYLTVDRYVDPKNNVRNYKVTNTGDAPLKGVEVMGQHVVPHALAPGESVQFDTLSAPSLIGKI